MDKATVLEIIKILDTKIAEYNEVWALIDFREHLQSCIEYELDAFENQTGE